MAEAVKKNRRFLVMVAIFIGMAILLRIPSLFEPNRYADEDIYLVLGQAMRKGLVLYRDIHDNKPPMIYLLAALAQSVFGFRLILLVWHAVTIILFLLLARSMGINRPFLLWASGLIFVLLSTLPILEGNIANGEIFMVMPLTAGMLVFWNAIQRKLPQSALTYGTIGLLMALGTLFKVTGVLEFAALLLFFIALSMTRFTDLMRRVVDQRLWFMVASFLIPILLTVAYFTINGAATFYIRIVLFQNIGYLSSWTGGSSNFLLLKGIILVLSLFGLFIVRRSVRPELLFISVWFLFSLFGALLSSRPYPHYLLQPVVPGALLIGLMFSTKRHLEFIAFSFLVAVTTAAIVATHFWYYPSLPYYQNFLRFALGKQSKSQFDGFFGGVTRNQRVASYVRSHTFPTDRIFIWGTEPAMYAMSDRLPVGRYTTSYHVRDFDPKGETLETIKRYPPGLIIVIDDEPDYQDFLGWVKGNTRLLTRIDGAMLYRPLTQKELSQ